MVTAKNYALVVQAIDQRADSGQYPQCKCIPYETVLTYKAWLALDLQVQQGNTGLRIPGEPVLFCRCQVEPFKQMYTKVVD